MTVGLRFLVMLCNLWEGWHGGAFSLGGGVVLSLGDRGREESCYLS